MPVKMRYTDDWRKSPLSPFSTSTCSPPPAAVAEILSVRHLSNGQTLYYIHFIDFNKRLDEWVTEDRLDLKKMQLPKKEVKTPLKNGSRPCSPDRDVAVSRNQ